MATTTKRGRDREAYLAERQARDEAAASEMADPESPILARLASDDPEIGERVRGYSLRNQVMLVQQAAELGVSLRDVGTFNEWTARGRRIITGQHGMRISRFRGDDEVAEGKARYGTVVLFSIDQTRPADAAPGEQPAAPAEPAAAQPPADAAQPAPQRL
ncbi:MAG: hypothetical protein HOV96_19420, partial [Nonomuraea sp.]|nr:hypothetical protein [Nonomuraea sp.]